MDLLRSFVAQFRILRHKWTNTDYKACRTCVVVFLFFAATIALPPVLIDTTIGGALVSTNGGILHKVIIDFEEERAAGASLNLGRYRVTFLPLLIGIFLPAFVFVAFGMVMLTWDKKLRNDQISSTHVRRRCGLILRWVCLLFCFACIIPIPCALIPWKSFGIAPWPNLYLTALLGLYWMEGLFIIPHVIAILLLWWISLVLANGMISPQTNAEVFNGG